VARVFGRAWVVALAGAVVTVAGLAAQSQTFRSGIELVNVGVMVLDRRGNFVTDLTPDNFELYEEGQKQAVSFFATGGN
jgi:hypothetical protein